MQAMYRTALLAAGMILFLQLSAHAEIRAGSFEVSPFGGYNIFENDQNLEDSLVIGGRLGYNFTKHFGIEGTVEYIRSHVDDRTVPGNKEGRYGRPLNDVDLTFYHIDAVYHFMPDSKLTPFVLAGFGGVHSSPEISTHDMAAFNVGVGIKCSLTDNVALRADLRDYMVTEIFQETFHNIGVTLGLVFSFGGNPAPATVQAQKAEVRAAPKAEVPIVILAAEPKVEEKVAALAAEPEIEEKVIVLAFEDIHFDFDKSTLTREAQDILNRNLRLLRENPKTKIRIAGYTSAAGTEEYNQKLSERRANAVKDYLVKEGVVAPDRLSKVGYGEENSAMYEVAPKDLYSKAAKANMRVLFEIIVK